MTEEMEYPPELGKYMRRISHAVIALQMEFNTPSGDIRFKSVENAIETLMQVRPDMARDYYFWLTSVMPEIGNAQYLEFFYGENEPAKAHYRLTIEKINPPEQIVKKRRFKFF